MPSQSTSSQKSRRPSKPSGTAGRSSNRTPRTVPKIPAAPTFVKRYGIFLAPVLLVLGFFVVLLSARSLLGSDNGTPATAPTGTTVTDTSADREFLHNTPYLQNTQNILILGSDRRPDVDLWRTDVIMIAAIDRTTGAAAVISLPRDLYVDIPGVGMGRINTADFFGSKGGKDMAAGAQTIAQIIRRDLEIEIDSYVRIDFNGFRDVINALGGIDVEVDCPLKDPFLQVAIGREIIEPGKYHMDGQFALAYVRSRQQGGDFDRARRQQRVLMAVRNQAVNSNLISRVPELVPAVFGTVETNLNPLEAMSLARWVLNMDISKLRGFVIDANMTQFDTTPSGEQVLKPNWDAIHKGISGLFSPASKPLTESTDRSWYCPDVSQ